MDWNDGGRDAAAARAQPSPDLMTGLEGSDCWDDPAVWDSLEQLGQQEESDLLEEILSAEETCGFLPDDEDILGPAESSERVCPLSRCAWARDKICVFSLGGWCPNQSAREKARSRNIRLRG